MPPTATWGRLAVAAATHSAAHRPSAGHGRQGDVGALIEAVRNTPTIRVIETSRSAHTDNNAVTGLQLRRADDVTARPATRRAGVVLATGGLGHLCGDDQSEGGGRAQARRRARAAVIAIEFVQFHPTAIMIGRDPPLATEALRARARR